MARKEYKSRKHDNVARLANWRLRCKYSLNRNEKWCEHQPDEIEGNERCKILWDMTIQSDHVIKARRPDIVVDKKESNKAIIVDITSPRDHRVYEKKSKKVEKYQDLNREI